MLCWVIVITDICRVELAENFIATGEEGPKDTKQDNQENYTGSNSDGDQDENASCKDIYR